jgi:hypothetical protein
MRFLLGLIFAFVATAAAFPQFHLLEGRKDRNGTSNGGGHRNGTRGNSVNKQCKQMSRMVRLTELAANQTKLDALVAKGKLNDTEVQAIKDKAANATTTLKTLQANATLVDECNVINANKAVKAQCFAMKRIEKMAALANNQTAMDAFAAKKKLNDTEITQFKEQVTKAETKLQEMQSNTTLTDLCAQQKQQKGQDDSGSASTGAAADTAPAQQATGGASTFTLQSIPYVSVSALVGVSMLFL